MKDKIHIVMISESEFTAQAHGVHTAYRELTDALRNRNDVDVSVNVFNRGADIVHVQTMGIYALMQVLWSGKRKVVSAHIVPASLVGSFVGAKHWLWIARWYMRFFYNRADRVLAVSQSVHDELTSGKMKLKIPVSILYNTVAMAQYHRTKHDRHIARAALGYAENVFMVVGNGQVQPRKRIDSFIETARQLPNVQFVWVGGITFKHLGAEYKKMMDMINDLPPNVTVTGVIAHDAVRQYLMASDVFFLPATQENHPMCVLEAAGAGIPIVLRNIPEYKDTFHPDASFFDTDTQAVELITRLRDDTAYYRQQCQAVQRIAQRFDSAAGAERVVQIYRELLNR